MFNSRKVQEIADIAVERAMTSIQGSDIILDSITDVLTQEWEDMALAERAGPSMWETLHWIAKAADAEQKPQVYISQLNIYASAHPCKDVCRPHIRMNLKRLDPSKYKSMFKHSVDLHNIVNRQLGKEIYPLRQAEKDYDLECDSCIFDPQSKKG
jgi:hypothetical protein